MSGWRKLAAPEHLNRMKFYRLALVALVLAGCQGPFGPPSPQDIADKPSQSSMQDGHFKVEAVILSGATHTNGTGDGVLVLKGKKGLKLNVQVSAGLLNVGVDLIAVGGKEYERIGNGAWTVSSDSATPATSSHGAPSYLGESQIGPDKAWHIHSKQSGTTYEEWVRESDGYLLKYALQSDTGSFTMNFDEFNIGADITAPSAKEIAGSQYLALVGPLNSQFNSVGSALDVDVRNQDLPAYKRDFGRVVDLDQQFLDGLAKIEFPAEVQGDAHALITAEQNLLAIGQQEAQATSWAQINAMADALTKAENAEHDAVTKVRADLGLPPSSS
jgi:hypothetical protein